MAHQPIDIIVEVLHGKRSGPCLLVVAGIHGDEINGTEIIRRLLTSNSLKRLKGTIMAVPVANFPAFVARMRYLPDRRDLNRLFPGSEKGSLGARLAHAISTNLLPACDAVIDLHTGAVSRPNLPQLRVAMDDPQSIELAQAFGAPVTMLAPLRPQSFRSIANSLGKPFILYEAGEALRLDAPSIRFGVQGILATMRHLEMLNSRTKKAPIESVISHNSQWERATTGGLFTPLVALGKAVEKNSVLGFVAPPFGEVDPQEIIARKKGIVIGRYNEGVVDEGDALFHIATFSDPTDAEDQIQLAEQTLPDDLGEDDHAVSYHAFTPPSS